MTMNSLLEAAHLSFTPMILDAVPMTKAETIMRREEALKMRWPLLSTYMPDFLRWPSCLVPQRRLDHHIACAEQVTGGADRCDCGVSPR